MMVTIRVPRKRERPIFFCGFFISPAMKVTLFHASLLKTDPTIAAAIPPNSAAPPIEFMLKPSEGLQISFILDLVACHAAPQFACHTSGWKAIKPAMIKPNKASSLVEVKIFWIHLLPFNPRVLVYVRNPMIQIEASWAALMVK